MNVNGSFQSACGDSALHANINFQLRVFMVLLNQSLEIDTVYMDTLVAQSFHAFTSCHCSS